MEYYRLHLSLLMWFSNSGQLLCLDSRSIGNSVISSQNSASLFSMVLGPQFSIPCVHKAHKGFSKEEDMGSGPGSMQSIKKLAPTGPPAGSIYGSVALTANESLCQSPETEPTPCSCSAAVQGQDTKLLGPEGWHFMVPLRLAPKLLIRSFILHFTLHLKRRKAT